MERKKEEREEGRYAYFSHRECEYFPCHPGADPENFNCLFCYCPLYALGDRCGGNFRYTEKEIKDCTQCLIPHDRKKEEREEGRYAYFSHRECEYFPCHPGADPENFNCLFCYCPLYALGDRCGGNFRYTEKGIKDCTQCLIPHDRKNYRKITGRFSEIAALARKKVGE